MNSTLYDAMIAVGITPPHKAKKTSRDFLRWGKNKSYWLKEFEGGAFFGDLTTRESHRWFEGDNTSLNAREMAERRAKLAQLRKQEKEAEERAYSEIAAQCVLRWNALPEAGKSAYLERKQVAAFDVRCDGGDLVIPLCDVNGNRHRGKGQQVMRVEHVTVNAGGQAIVGNVTQKAGGGVNQKTEEQPHAPAE